MLIQPKALAMELISMIPMQTGAKYFIKKKYNFLRRKAEDCSTSRAMASRPTTRVIRKQVARAANGIMIELVRKSKKSRMDIPSKVTKSRELNPRAEAEPRTKIITAINRLHFLRLHPN